MRGNGSSVSETRPGDNRYALATAALSSRASSLLFRDDDRSDHAHFAVHGDGIVANEDPAGCALDRNVKQRLARLEHLAVIRLNLRPKCRQNIGDALAEVLGGRQPVAPGQGGVDTQVAEVMVHEAQSDYRVDQ